MRKLPRAVCFCLLLACCTPILSGQQRDLHPPLHLDISAADPQQNVTYCSLSGSVTTANGEPLPGASVQLTAPVLPPRSDTTDADGRFAITNLPPGTFSVTVSLDGFNSVTGAVRLAPGANVATVTFALRPSVSDSVDVSASQKDIAEAQIHLQEQQRVAGVLPNFFVSYIWRATPLAAGQKFGLALKSAADPGNLLLVGTVSAVQQATNSFPGYGQGWKGYGRRYGADLGNLVSGTFMGSAILPSIFRQDPRYFYKGTGSNSSRFWYAVSRIGVTRGDNGKPEPNFSTILGDMSAGAISNLYYAPSDRRGAGLTLVNGVLALGGDALNNVFQEFVLKKLTTNHQHDSLYHE
jgi:hypothetical protein